MCTRTRQTRGAPAPPRSAEPPTCRHRGGDAKRGGDRTELAPAAPVATPGPSGAATRAAGAARRRFPVKLRLPPRRRHPPPSLGPVRCRTLPKMVICVARRQRGFPRRRMTRCERDSLAPPPGFKGAGARCGERGAGRAGGPVPWSRRGEGDGACVPPLQERGWQPPCPSAWAGDSKPQFV